MKSYRRLLPYALLVLIVVLMSGCIPKIKNPADFTPPSWIVDVTVPIMKTNLDFGKEIASLFQSEDIIIDEETRFFSFFKNFSDDLGQLEIPDLTVLNEKLEFDPEPYQAGSSLSVSYLFAALETNIIIDGGVGDVLVPSSGSSFRYSDLHGGNYIYVPFGRARFSDSPENKLTFTLVTDEPLDTATLVLLDRYEADGVWVEEEIGTAEFALPNLENEVSIPSTQYTADISLANKVIHGELDFRVDIAAHSTEGHISVTMPTNVNLDMVELEGFVLGDSLNFDLPQFQIPEFKLLSSVPGLSRVQLKSGLIRLTQDTSLSCQDHPMPFLVTLSDLSIVDVDENNQPIVLRTSTDEGNGSWVFDLTDLTLTDNSAFRVTIDVELLPEGLVYDIYEDSSGEIKPYTYDFQCSIEDIVLDHVAGDISELVDDPSPETPEWDYRLDNNNTGIMALAYPEGLETPSIGISDLDLIVSLDNNTSLLGDFSITLNIYEYETGGTPNDSVTFILNVDPRTNNVWDFSQGALGENMEHLIHIINQRPKYYEVKYGGGLGLDDNFWFGSGDYIAPAGEVTVPISISIKPGGATIENVMEQTIDDPSQQQVAEQIAEFIEEASLHIKYRNTSTLGFGSIFTFTADGKEPVTVPVVLYNREADQEYIEEEFVLTVDTALLDIISSNTGYTISSDLVIPNASETEWREMGLTSDDSLSITVWLDGKIKAHVPGQM